MLLVLKKVWVWVKKYWKYLLFPIGILVGIIGFIGRRKPEVIAPELLDAEEKEREINEEAEKRLDEVEEKRRKQVEDVEREHAETIQKLTDEQKEKLEELREDPDELNDFLLEVGKSVRRG